MRYLTLACDYDGTLASDGTVPPSTLAAIEMLAASGRKPILATGRVLDDLLEIFPENAIFERIVSDNGGVLYCPATGEVRTLVDPPPPEFIRALRRANIEPLAIGRAMIATVKPHDQTVLRIIRELGLKLQVIYNKNSAMILPAGIDKGTGLLAALDDLNLSGRDAVGIGDAENDLALLSQCALGVAVANATPELKELADITTFEPAGRGVEELIGMLLLDDLSNAEVQPQRSFDGSL